MPNEKQIRAGALALEKLINENPLTEYEDAARVVLTAAEQAEPAPAARSGAVKEIVEEICEGWCKENGGRGSFNDCFGCRIHRDVAALETAEPATDAEPTRKVIYEALRFANWAAGQGICPIEGEPASAPEDFLMEYSKSTDDEDWEGLANRIYTHPPESRLREALERIANGSYDGLEVTPLPAWKMREIARAALAQGADDERS